MINSMEELRALLLGLGAKEEKLDGFTFLELDCGPGSKTKNEVNEREASKMKKYKVSNSELGYEQRTSQQAKSLKGPSIRINITRFIFRKPTPV
jgi:hypothetical protein